MVSSDITLDLDVRTCILKPVCIQKRTVIYIFIEILIRFIMIHVSPLQSIVTCSMAYRYALNCNGMCIMLGSHYSMVKF